jgi:hypothetical protein
LRGRLGIVGAALFLAIGAIIGIFVFLPHAGIFEDIFSVF